LLSRYIKLGVNIDHVATLRNARGGNVPDLLQVATDLQRFGAQGITIHPRPDERHITREDAYALKQVIKTEYNIEGYPSEEFIEMVINIQPTQVTLVPDGPEVLTSNAGWDCIKQQDFLTPIVKRFHEADIRVSLFIDPIPNQAEAAKKCGADRVELYTEAYASEFYSNKEKAILPYKLTAEKANNIGLEINAGHDLNLDNLSYFIHEIPIVKEVSIGHALISDSLYLGLNNAVQLYKSKINSI